MQNRDRIKRQSMVNMVLNIVIAGLCFLTLIMGGVAASNLHDTFSVGYDDKNLYYCVRDGDFVRLLEQYYTNVQEGHKGSFLAKEYYGVAKYYEAASLYKAYSETGDTVRADRELAKMEAALEEMGGWSMLEEDIKKQLGF